LNEKEYWKISYIKTGDIENKISPQSLNKWDDEKGLKFRGLDGDWKGFWEIGIWGRVQRRGAHVNTPEKGSRDGGNCFGGIQRFHADLRREMFWGNFNLVFLMGLGVVPRGGVEEGGTTCAFWGNLCHLKEFCRLLVYYGTTYNLRQG
jgi:hypothetical protein